jgi:hypothetical protein
MKSIFAFQQLDGQGEVIVLGMYVHEYGPDAPKETAGRVLIECVDSIPIHGNERSDERQRLLTAIVHGYIEYVKSMGFAHIHLRVPPPSAEDHHIFSPRSLSVRVEATVRMAHWYRRLLEGAQSKGIITNFDMQSHLSKMESFPPAMLPSSDLAEEHAFSTMLSQLSRNIQSGKRNENDVRLFHRLSSFRDRFCVASLHGMSADAPQFRLDGTPNMATAMTSRRLTFVMACKRENISFGTLADAKMSTMLLLARMISDQRNSLFCQPNTSAAAVKRAPESEDLHQHDNVTLSPEALVGFHRTSASGHGESDQQQQINNDNTSMNLSHASNAWAAVEQCQETGQDGFDQRRGGCLSIDDLHWDDAQREGDAGGMDAEMFADSLLSM